MSHPILPDVVRRLQSVGDPALSSDGNRLAYTLSWVDREQLDGRSRIMMLERPSHFSRSTQQSV